MGLLERPCRWVHDCVRQRRVVPRGGDVFERLSALDASFLYLDRGHTPMHVGALSILDRPAGGMDIGDVRRLVAQRLPHVPRYRMRVRDVPLGLGRPVWVPDPQFDIEAHIRPCVLPRPGTHAQLVEVTARILARPLDRSRPLWEIHVVEGLNDGNLAIVSKTHEVLVDGRGALDIAHVLLGTEEFDPGDMLDGQWRQVASTSDWELFASTMTTPLVHPRDALRSVSETVTSTTARVTSSFSEAGRWIRQATTAAVSMARTPVETSLQADVGSHRRFATASVPLEAFQSVHRAVGMTVHDAILTVIAGALRSWLVGRGAAVDAASVIRALIPVSTSDLAGTASPVSAFLIDLPVGEPDPIIRLRRVSHESSAYTDVARALGAPTLVSIAGFGPATLHALGARLAAGMSSRVFNLAITNVPGPQRPLFAGRARLLASFPVMPLVSGQALALGVTSYDGTVFLGANADRDAVPDLDDLMAVVPEAVDELLEAAGGLAVDRYAEGASPDRGAAQLDDAAR